MTRSPHLRRDRDDRGTSLVELLVAMAVWAVVVTLTSTILIRAQQDTARTIGRADAVADLEVATRTVGRQVRAGGGQRLYFDTGSSETSPSTALGFRTALPVTGTPTSRCVQYKVVDGVLRTRTFELANPGARTAWSTADRVVSGVSSPAPFQPVAGTPAGVRMQLSATPSGGRTASVDVSLTARNTTGTAPSGTDPCSDLT